MSGAIASDQEAADKAGYRLGAEVKEAPNFVVILLDDVGFGAASTFGGPVQTPSLERLATEGLRYNNFHTTAICASTRASLLSGRNHHRVGFGSVFYKDYPGYDGVWKKDVASIAELLRINGYSTAAFGKWHNTPPEVVTPVGPFDRWPTGLGFEYFYGFIGAETSQWEPVLYRNTLPVEAPSKPSSGYHFTTDITNEAIGWVHAHQTLAPNKPYFLYFAPGGTHSPHQVPKEWVAKYHGLFDQGWDVLRKQVFNRQKKLGVIPPNAELTKRPGELPAWDSLTRDQKKLYARQMEVYAAFLEHTDYEIGRLLQVVRSERGENTAVFYIVGDNGGSGEGGMDGTDAQLATLAAGVPRSVASQLEHVNELGSLGHDNIYAAGWGWATNTPFQWMKQIASHFGGTRNPMVVSWPAGIQGHGEIRSQFTHVVDVVPTLLELSGIRFPSEVNGIPQKKLDGYSFADSFTDKKTSPRHRVQYFEINGNRAIYEDGWIASARHAFPWLLRGRNDNFDQDRWELYNVEKDFSQAHDLASKYPDKLKKLQVLFDSEAKKNDVYPLNNPYSVKLIQSKVPERIESIFYYSDIGKLHTTAAPNFNRSHRISAEVNIPGPEARGVILSAGGRAGGFALYVKDGRLTYEKNFCGLTRQKIVSSEPVPIGKTELTYEFVKSDAGSDAGVGRLFFGRRLVGEAMIRDRSLLDYDGGAFSVGQAFGSPVSQEFDPPFKFTGEFEGVLVQLR